MPATGIVLPDLAGIAGLKPLRIAPATKFTATGQQFLRSDVCPPGKLWYIGYTSVGFNDGDVSDCLVEIEDANNARKAILAMFPDLTKAKTENFFATYWIGPGEKLAARFNVVTTSPTSWLTALGFELVFSG